MKLEHSSGTLPLVECTSIKYDTWRVRIGGEKVTENDQEGYEYYSEVFYHKPTLDEIKSIIYDHLNDQINQNILSGFVWQDMPVWLSAENQFNYKAAYDLAVQTQGASLPVVFKFGTTEEPVYHTFTDLEEFKDFYTKAMSYINNQLLAGWMKKDSINWEDYKIENV